MSKNIIYVSEAILLIGENKFTPDLIVDFQNEKVNVVDAVLLGKNGIDVPDELIDYDDENIDYSDIPAITDEDLASGKIRWTMHADIPLEKEISDWIRKEDINLNELAAKLIRDFYDGMKSFPKNTHYEK